MEFNIGDNVYFTKRVTHTIPMQRSMSGVTKNLFLPYRKHLLGRIIKINNKSCHILISDSSASIFHLPLVHIVEKERINKS